MGLRQKLQVLCDGYAVCYGLVPPLFGASRIKTAKVHLRSRLPLFLKDFVEQPAQAGGALMAQQRIGAAGLR